jgi:NCAIR mutase (PurE)-related protein
MVGRVYMTTVDHLNIDRHPHVVMALDGKQCLVVAAYTEGKYKIEEKINALRAMAYRDDQIFVRMDNAKHFINCAPKFVGHAAIWFIHQFYWDQKKKFESLASVAEMNAEGMAMIAGGLINIISAGTSLLSQKHQEQLSKLIPPI